MHLLEQRLTLEEYSERVEQAWAADERHDLDGLLSDLPLLPPAQARATGVRHGEDDAPAVTWRPTRERFRDPTTHRVMRVWVDVADGSRHYVAER